MRTVGAAIAYVVTHLRDTRATRPRWGAGILWVTHLRLCGMRDAVGGGMNEITFADVAAAINAHRPTAREREAARRESARLAALRASWEAERRAAGASVDPFEDFEA
jgi:hypothetical protein